MFKFSYSLLLACRAVAAAFRPGVAGFLGLSFFASSSSGQLVLCFCFSSSAAASAAAGVGGWLHRVVSFASLPQLRVVPASVPGSAGVAVPRVPRCWLVLFPLSSSYFLGPLGGVPFGQWFVSAGSLSPARAVLSLRQSVFYYCSIPF